jgi:protein-arginine kinase activator protein McsA
MLVVNGCIPPTKKFLTTNYLSHHMSYCLNLNCQSPQNKPDIKFCVSCGSKVLLAERYRAIKQIGQGGFGRTFLAVDEYKPSKPYCVIKQLLPQAQGTDTVKKAAELFELEAARLDELGRNHPQIPELLAYFTQDSQQYLVQEFIDGQNLTQEVIQFGAYNEEKVIAFLQNLLPVLEFVHSKQVIHRDIKPDNIIRRRNGELVLVDFGATKTATPTALAVTGTVIGTQGYTAPEQALGKATFASDIYSLGVTCLYLLTRIQPFDLFDVLEGEWVWKNYLSAPVSSNLEQVLEKMIQSAVKRRYQSATELLQALNLGETHPQKSGGGVISTPSPDNFSSAVGVKPLLAKNQIRCPFCGYTFDGTNLSGEIACYRCHKHFHASLREMKVPLLAKNQIRCPFCGYTFDGTNLSGEIACYRCHKHFHASLREMKVPLLAKNQIRCPFCGYTFDGTNLSGEIACYRCYKHFHAS